MDSPDRLPSGSAAAGAVAAAASPSEDSPVFNFINSLSPIAPPKPLDSSHNVQLFKSLDFAPVSSIFTSPHVNPQKESKLPIRDASAQLSQEGHSPNSVRTRTGTSSFIRLSRCTVLASEKCSITCSLNEASLGSPVNASILPSKLPQSIQLDGDSLKSDKKQRTDGKTDCTIDHECTKLAGVILDKNGRGKMDTSTSGRNVQESQLPEQNKVEGAARDWDYLITDHANGVVSKLDPSFEAEAQLVNETIKTDDIISCKPFLSTDDPNLENSRGKLFHGSSGSYIDNAAGDPHIYWAGAVEGAATGYTPQMLPGACQNQLVSNDQICEKPKAPFDHNAIPQHLRGMRRRSLFNERAGAPYVGVYTDSNLPASSTARCKGISGENHLKPVGTPMCALPGIGLHLNALALISKDNIAPYDTQSTGDTYSNMPFGINSPPGPPLTSEQSCQINPVVGNELVPFISEVDSHILNDDCSKTTMCEKTDEPGQDSPKKKRRKFESGDGDSCKRCSCKKSKCLKLYCECFAARVFCSESCSCIGCLNTRTHEETVLSTRKQIESRNPLAFAPKVIHTSEPGQEVGQDSNKTPASARHKRGCNCKKSSCLKKYCECYQGGVGCSMSCRCEGCKNAFGRRIGVVPLGSEEIERGGREKNAHEREEKSEIENLLAIDHTDLSSTENLLTTPLIESCRPLVMLPPTNSMLPLSSIRYSSRLYNSQAPLKADVVLSPFESYAEMILGDGPSDILKGDSSPCTSIKVVSPNKKRVSPPRIGTGLSPIGKSGRKLILKSIPSFPSLTGDVNNERPVT